MEVEVRKINFIREFLRLNNQKSIEKLESVLRAEKKKIYSKIPEPMSIEEFNQMIEKAEKDVEEGRVVEARELKKEVQKWR